MFADIMENCKNWDDEKEVCNYLNKILDKKAFDKAGLIYGMGPPQAYVNTSQIFLILQK